MNVCPDELTHLDLLVGLSARPEDLKYVALGSWPLPWHAMTGVHHDSSPGEQESQRAVFLTPRTNTAKLSGNIDSRICFIDWPTVGGGRELAAAFPDYQPAPQRPYLAITLVAVVSVVLAVLVVTDGLIQAELADV